MKDKLHLWMHSGPTLDDNPVKLKADVIDCHIYDLGAFEIQIEDVATGLDIRLNFLSEDAKDQFLSGAAEVRRDA